MLSYNDLSKEVLTQESFQIEWHLLCIETKKKTKGKGGKTSHDHHTIIQISKGITVPVSTSPLEIIFFKIKLMKLSFKSHFINSYGFLFLVYLKESELMADHNSDPLLSLSAKRTISFMSCLQHIIHNLTDMLKSRWSTWNRCFWNVEIGSLFKQPFSNLGTLPEAMDWARPNGFFDEDWEPHFLLLP
jgi:hypothetical protein